MMSNKLKKILEMPNTNGFGLWETGKRILEKQLNPTIDS